MRPEEYGVHCEAGSAQSHEIANNRLVRSFKPFIHAKVCQGQLDPQTYTSQVPHFDAVSLRLIPVFKP